MNGSPLKYFAAAFNVRPWGMFVPPNWIILAGFVFLGLLNPGFWIVGLGVELGIVFTLAFNQRFQRLVDSLEAQDTWKQAQAKVETILAQLPNNQAQRFKTLQAKCEQMLADRSSTSVVLAETLNQMLWVYIRLLRAQSTLSNLLSANSSDSADQLKRELASLNQKIPAATSPELKKSLESQAEIITARLKTRAQAFENRLVVVSEIDRIEQQVEHFREQIALARTPEDVSGQIDSITASLSSTNTWIVEQQHVMGVSPEEEQLASVPLIHASKE